jgi:hypothetical protein
MSAAGTSAYFTYKHCTEHPEQCPSLGDWPWIVMAAIMVILLVLAVAFPKEKDP